MARNTENFDRRRFLKTVGVTLGVAAGSAGAAASGASSTGGDGRTPPEKFHVEGRKVIRRKVTPERVETTVRKVSPDLRERYGKATVATTHAFERPDDRSEDPYPERDVETWTRDWETYYAKEDEWRALAEDDGVDTLSDHRWVEEANPYGTWEYEADGSGGYAVTAPMNVVTPAAMSDVVSVLDGNGYTTTVVQYDRHAWNSATGEFEVQHRSAATGTFGFLGRKHVKFWEYEGYTSGSAHVDSAVPHEATSFEDAEQHVEGVFDGANGWHGLDDYYDLNNGGYLDHDGEATRPYDA